MNLPAPNRRYTREEYFELERASEEKYEYHDGTVVARSEVLAMAGGSVRHISISTNIAVVLGMALRGGPCRAFGSDLRVGSAGKTLYAYPDVTVVCGPPAFEADRSAGETVTNPRLIVEVLSPSTEANDRGEKFNRYLQTESLQEYVLVSQHTPRVETYFRRDDGTWLFTHRAGLGSSVHLRSLDLDLPLHEVYAGVTFDAPPVSPDGRGTT